MREASPTRSDEELMAAHVDGDRAAFDEIFARHAGLVTRLTRRYAANDQDAHDLAQQAFLNLHRARHDFRPGARLKPWLVTIALNLGREHARWRGRRREDELDAGDEPVSEATQPRALEQAELRARVRSALDALPAGQREVIELHWFAGLTFPEVSAALGVGVSAVKVRAHRAYQKLRELLATGDGNR